MQRAEVLANTAELINAPEKTETAAINAFPYDYKKFLSKIVDAYDSTVIRAYCKARFKIININILQMLGLCLRGKRRILDVGCGFGLFGCYFSAMYPEINYCGYDLNAGRIEQATRAAERLGLKNVSFHCGDARDLKIEDEYDAVLMVDLLHHINDEAKAKLLETCAAHLAPDGRLIIKDVTTHPFPKIAFTWWLDVLMTGGFEMWFRNEKFYYELFGRHFNRIEMYPITDWLPYPHVIYLCENISFNDKSENRLTA
jgi:2-polyprenyl-3-methyl-5-hydroxy-6-metoxy-1,4-benzoquinol methylase